MNLPKSITERYGEKAEELSICGCPLKDLNAYELMSCVALLVEKEQRLVEQHAKERAKWFSLKGRRG